MLDREQYLQNAVNNDEEFAYSVEKFEFELFDHFKTNKVVVSNHVFSSGYLLFAFFVTEIISNQSAVFKVSC